MKLSEMLEQRAIKNANAHDAFQELHDRVVALEQSTKYGMGLEEMARQRDHFREKSMQLAHVLLEGRTLHASCEVPEPGSQAEQHAMDMRNLGLENLQLKAECQRLMSVLHNHDSRIQRQVTVLSNLRMQLHNAYQERDDARDAIGVLNAQLARVKEALS